MPNVYISSKLKGPNLYISSTLKGHYNILRNTKMQILRFAQKALLMSPGNT